MSKDQQESKKIAYSYLATFYNNTELLNQYYSQYSSLLIQMKVRYGTETIKGMDPQDRALLIQLIDAIRQTIVTLSMRAISVINNSDRAEEKDIEEIEELRTKIEEEYVMNTELVYKFLIKINDVLVKTTVPDLLKDNQDMLEVMR